MYCIVFYVCRFTSGVWSPERSFEFITDHVDAEVIAEKKAEVDRAASNDPPGLGSLVHGIFKL